MDKYRASPSQITGSPEPQWPAGNSGFFSSIGMAGSDTNLLYLCAFFENGKSRRNSNVHLLTIREPIGKAHRRDEAA